VEDAAAAIAYLHDRTHAFHLRVDPGKIYLVGHSMGGFVAVEAAAADPEIKGVILISAADMAARALDVPADKKDAAIKGIAAGLAEEGMAPLAGTTSEALAKETLANAAQWSFIGLAPKFTTRPLFVITSDDGLAPTNDAFVAAIKKAGGNDVKTLHIATDHSYSDSRIALEKAVVEQLTR
jgi:pimeloyl-ACP methyl ester carboxylesterase